MKSGFRLILLTSALVFAAWNGKSIFLEFSSEHWPVELVSVEGMLNAGEKQQIRNAIAAHLNHGLLFVDLNDVVDSVMALSWPREVEVRRHWPGNLLLSVKKQSIVARWNDSEYLSTSGQVVKGTDRPEQELPGFYAKHSDGIRTMEIYRDLNRVIQSAGERRNLKIVELHEDIQGGWQVKFETGFGVVLGREMLNARLARFVNVYRQSLHKEKKRLVSVDARYRNGVAVKWMNPILKGDLLSLAAQGLTGNGRR